MPKVNKRKALAQSASAASSVIRKEEEEKDVESFEEKLKEHEVEEMSVEKEDDDDDEEEYIPGKDDTLLMEKLQLSDIADLFELCKTQTGVRNLSVLLYTLLRHVGLPWGTIDDLLASIGAYRCKTAHKSAKIFPSGDFNTFTEDNRGGKQSNSFYDTYPELEMEAKAFAIQGYSQKAANFTAGHLARFIDDKYYEITQSKKSEEGLVRSEKSCRLDLRRWEAKFQPNSQPPYFEGHERADVVAHREQFVSYFVERKAHYYTVKEGDNPDWQSPTAKPCVLIRHDESTFRPRSRTATRSSR
ncbi:unnamed protein product [Didymodactylos carnosus]|uniref:Uncharacterized protein n=1 Tax=Didymodactylos carnosus TaxID=1234261 RepID=A0A816BJI1_9BILA|nr:unnamed protein product [Didymodactylos carnosus]CAF1610092.1 unnamed protein product [Didymodactylos carnosus]CAF3601757.1 unnamed protein product [Didymodactylos carnosus]CAF4492811.1 unnamed protein product [Didymodactylos carnosus]